MTFADEVRVGDTETARKYDISSSCDGVFTVYRKKGELLEPMMRIGLEIKTASPSSFAALKGPQEKHIEQAHVYMACLDLPVMWFMYWNKENENYTTMKAPWLVPFDQAVWSKLEGRATDCLTLAAEEKLPEREEGFHCTWCPYSYTCNPKQQTRGSASPVRNLMRPIRKGT